MNAFSIAAVVTSILAFALSIASTFLPAWWTDGTGIITYGFVGACAFRICAFGLIKPFSLSIEVRVAFAFMILSVIFTFMGAVFSIVGMAKGNAKHMKIGGVLLITAGVCAIVGSAVVAGYTSTINQVFGISLGLSFGYSFGLAWAAAVIALIGGVFAVMASKKQ